MITYFKRLYKRIYYRWFYAQLLKTDEGRSYLAQEMVAPIRRSLEYQAIGRKLLMVDPLPEGAMKTYDNQKD